MAPTLFSLPTEPDPMLLATGDNNSDLQSIWAKLMDLSSTGCRVSGRSKQAGGKNSSFSLNGMAGPCRLGSMSEGAPTETTNRPAGSWEGWVASQGEVFFLYARQQTRSESDAKDVMQEALTEAWRRTGGVTPDRGLVFATIRRRAVDLGRSIDRRARREINYMDGQAPWFVPDFSANDTREQLASAIEDLPDHLREVLVLRIWCEMSFPAISEIIEVPLATANSRYRYALERLRENESLTELRP